MIVQEKRYAVADLRIIAELPGNEDKRFELISGVLYELMSPSPTHAFISQRFARYVDEFVEEHDLGYVFSDGCVYTLSDEDELIPDASFVSKARAPELSFPKTFNFAPDLAIEVISPSNKPRDILKNMPTYFKYRTRLGWVLAPDEQEVDVYRRGADGSLSVHTVGIDDILDSVDVLPGFRLPARKLFPK
jgi:Uma2 family endonuclease